MVVFDILSSHWRMRAWHEAQLEQNSDAVNRIQQVQKSASVWHLGPGGGVIVVRFSSKLSREQHLCSQTSER